MVEEEAEKYYRATFKIGKRLKIVYHVEGERINGNLYPKKWKINKFLSKSKECPFDELKLPRKGGKSFGPFLKSFYNIRRLNKNPFSND